MPYLGALTWLLRETNIISQNSDSLWKLFCAGSGNIIPSNLLVNIVSSDHVSPVVRHSILTGHFYKLFVTDYVRLKVASGYTKYLLCNGSN